MRSRPVTVSELETEQGAACMSDRDPDRGTTYLNRQYMYAQWRKKEGINMDSCIIKPRLSPSHNLNPKKLQVAES